MPYALAVKRKKRAKVLLFSELAKKFCIFFIFHAEYIEKLLYFCSLKCKNIVLVTTEAIVLNLQRHSDRSHILHTYTRSHGRMNFLVYGLGSKKKSAAPYAPLSFIELTADIRPDRPIATLKEAHLLATQSSLPEMERLLPDFQLKKSAVSLFLAEFLYRILKHPMPDEALFNFLGSTLPILDNTASFEDFHTNFLVGFAARLGFAIDENEHPELLRVPVSRADR